MCILEKTPQNNMHHKVISGFLEEKELEDQNIGGEDYEYLFYRGIF